ncbi:MAG TPA: BrnA antitoxin family protein [Allosphingosinicella sp.]|nr:BrnA antitoxin family protein [Allosphingosinicella sp.]
MIEKERSTRESWVDPDDPPEWPDEVWERAQIAIGDRIIRPATGTLTKPGRPPIGDEPKRQVTLRLPRHVLEHFKADGPGWQTRIGEVLERHAEEAKRKSA